MKSRIWPALTPAEIRKVNWAAIANAAADALGRGWTGLEVGSAAIENLGPAVNIGALMVTNIRELALVDPPREVTPIPPAIDRARQAKMLNAASRKASDWASRIRGSLS